MNGAKGRARVQRRILREHDSVLALGDFEEFFEAYHAHVRRWNLTLDDLGTVMMHQALAGAALQLSFRRPDETTAWTVNVDRPPANLFVTGGSRQDVLTGRYFMEGVATTGESRFYVQRTQPGREPSLSMIPVRGLDVLGYFEQFFERSEQSPARFLELSSTRMAMVMGLPGVDEAWVRGLDAAAVRDLLDNRDEEVEERHFRFHCGCDGDRMAEVLVRLYRADPVALFEGDDGVETTCPRCGSLWWIDRELFDRTRMTLGDDSA